MRIDKRFPDRIWVTTATVFFHNGRPENEKTIYTCPICGHVREVVGHE